uniref:Uncharacterized protein n=1 Tax=Romanomermis culicivorax TaxID=13658 RepID=A0A915I521_ROMCU
MSSLAYISVISSFLAVCQADVQRIGVMGTLYCKGKPFQGATVTIVDKNTGPDTGLDEKKTDNNGSFLLDATSSSLTSKIDPYLKIYHTCDTSRLQLCKRRWVFKIPKDQIFSKNDKKFKPVNFGLAELTFVPNQEDSKCTPVG